MATRTKARRPARRVRKPPRRRPAVGTQRLDAEQRARVEAEKASRRVATEIRKAGLKVATYGSGPNGAAVFTIAIDERAKSFRLWAGTAKVTVYPSKDHRQAVIRVQEKARTIVEKVVHSLLPTEAQKGWTIQQFARNEYLRDRNFIDKFPVALPNNDAVRWAVTDHTEVSERERKANSARSGLADNNRRYFEATVTARVEETDQTFLIGKDEMSLFISMLPRAATSVERAHDVLRPKGVPKDAPRQGEWFFVPVSQDLQRKLDMVVARDPYSLEMRVLDDDNDSHYASVIVFERQQYAIGPVVDDRGTRRRGAGRAGRTPTHHEPLILHDWHRVVKNTEVEPPREVRGGGSWD